MKNNTTYALVIDPAKAIFSKPMLFPTPTENQIKTWAELKMQVVILNEEDVEECVALLNSTVKKAKEQILAFVLAFVTIFSFIIFLISIANK